jgi:hypothetical protein
MSPRALGSAVSMMEVSPLIVRFDPRKLIAIGLTLSGAEPG